MTEIPHISHIIDFLKSPKGIAVSLVLIAVIFNAVFLWAEVGVSTSYLNDEALHLTATQDTSLAIRQGLDPTDYWVTQIDLGYPIGHYYQHLPYVVLAGLDQVTSSFITLPHLFDLTRYLLLVLFPLSMYLAMRRFGFDYLASSLSALLVTLLSTYDLFGIEYSSYVWLGHGLYTQLWGMFFLPLALAEIYRTIKGNESWFWSVLLFAIVLLSNLIYGYILVISAVLFIFISPNRPDLLEIYSRFKKIVILFLLTGAVTAYFFVSVLFDLNYFNRSLFLDPIKYTSYGAVNILTKLYTGNLFDYGRLPIITILFAFALLFVIRKWKDEKYLLLLVFTFFWLVVYFGPATWGNTIYTVLPFSQNLQFHRFIAGFQIGAIMIVGAGLSLAWDWIKKMYVEPDNIEKTALVGLIFLVILSPVLIDRVNYYQGNTLWRQMSQGSFVFYNSEITDIKNTITNLSPGRVYAGVSYDFGNDYRFSIGKVPIYSLLPQLGIDTFGYAYTSFPLSSDVRLAFKNTRSDEYNLFNIKYVLLAKTWTPAYYYTKIKSFEHFDLYQIPTTGYFDLVDTPAIFYGNTADFFYPNSKWLDSSLPQQKQNPIVVLGNKPVDTAGLPAYSFADVTPDVLTRLSLIQPAGGYVINETVLPNEYRASFTITRNCYLMLKTNYHPGWVVTVDDKKVTPVMLSPGFIGVPVTPGTHSADFIYHSPAFRLPLLLFGVILLVILLIVEWSQFRIIFPSLEMLKIK